LADRQGADLIGGDHPAGVADQDSRALTTTDDSRNLQYYL